MGSKSILLPMITHSTDTLTLHFGTQREGFIPQQFYAVPTQQELCTQDQFASLQLKNLITLAQTHSTTGYIVTREFTHAYRPYNLTGDYLITHEPDIALGVATADCLPIVLFDPIKYVLAVIHAGWRGTADGITLTALHHLQQTYHCSPDTMQVFFGPAARSCCYEVQSDFLTHFSPNPVGLEPRDNKLFFDVSTYNKELLIKAGIPAQNINQAYNLCTICDTQFCSYRRDGAQSQRQMTIAHIAHK